MLQSKFEFPKFAVRQFFDVYNYFVKRLQTMSVDNSQRFYTAPLTETQITIDRY